MHKLNLPEYPIKRRSMGEKEEVFDVVRKKYVALTPEEWVRQHFINFLIREKHTPASLISVERKLIFNGMPGRTDLVVYNRQAEPKMVIECKSAEVKISQDVFDQIARYNMTLKVNYLIVTNGIEHFCCRMDYNRQKYQFVDNIPDYEEL